MFDRFACGMSRITSAKYALALHLRWTSMCMMTMVAKEFDECCDFKSRQSSTVTSGTVGREASSAEKAIGSASPTSDLAVDQACGDSAAHNSSRHGSLT